MPDIKSMAERTEFYGDPHRYVDRRGVAAMEDATTRRYDAVADAAKARAYAARRAGDREAEAEATAEMHRFRAMARERTRDRGGRDG